MSISRTKSKKSLEPRPFLEQGERNAYLQHYTRLQENSLVHPDQMLTKRMEEATIAHKNKEMELEQSPHSLR